MKTILVIDDDLHIGNMLQELLQQEGYAVLRAYSGTEALLVVEKQKPDLILLDLMLPGMPGEMVLQKVKAIPTIVLSAKMDTMNKVDLLLAGAVDYVTKPFDTRELLARIVVALRNAKPAGSLLHWGNVTLDPTQMLVTADGQPIKLTRTEYAILKTLMVNAHQVVTKSILLDKISEDTPDCTESSLKMHVSNLRRKLREAGCGDCIEAVWGIGFKMAES